MFRTQEHVDSCADPHPRFATLTYLRILTMSPVQLSELESASSTACHSAYDGVQTHVTTASDAGEARVHVVRCIARY